MPIWGGCNKEDINSLQVLQSRADQIVPRLPPRTNREKIFQQSGWLSVKQMNDYFSTMAVFEVRMSGEPAAIAENFRNESRTGRITLSQE